VGEVTSDIFVECVGISSRLRSFEIILWFVVIVVVVVGMGSSTYE